MLTPKHVLTHRLHWVPERKFTVLVCFLPFLLVLRYDWYVVLQKSRVCSMMVCLSCITCKVITTVSLVNTHLMSIQNIYICSWWQELLRFALNTAVRYIWKSTVITMLSTVSLVLTYSVTGSLCLLNTFVQSTPSLPPENWSLLL